jgi:hypothetical protein
MDAITTTTADIAAGSNVSIPVTTSDGLQPGQEAIIDTGGNWEPFNVTAVPDATHVVADALGKGHTSGSAVRLGIKQGLLTGTVGVAAAAPFGSGSPGIEYPPGFEPTAVFLARILIPAIAGGADKAPAATFELIKPPDNSHRLFVVPNALVSRWVGLTSGTEGS